ncbi:hypothetical protein [Beijerinckia sp. L45]|uniref:hypothetical protein n=1 Tax=Beijerinckia sp. L45 TaxID=1641855 RepID=UPI00131E3B03|nr:hypothetical protein [Beijerinckia sp. L45]
MIRHAAGKHRGVTGPAVFDSHHDVKNRPTLWSINGRFLTQRVTGLQRYAREMTKAIDVRLAVGEALARRVRWDVVVPADYATVPVYQKLTVRRSRAAMATLESS